MTGILVDVHRNAVEFVEGEFDLHRYHDLIKCDCIDIVRRRIGGMWFDIVLDDEGLLKDSIPSAIDMLGYVQLVGNLLVFGIDDDECDMRSLDDVEATAVMNHMCTIEGQHFLVLDM